MKALPRLTILVLLALGCYAGVSGAVSSRGVVASGPSMPKPQCIPNADCVLNR